MNSIYVDSKFDDEKRRQQLYAGQLFVYSPRPSALAFTNFAAEMIKDAFGKDDPTTAVDAPRRQQLLGAYDAEFVTLFGADQILSTLASRERKIAGANLASTRQISQQSGVLVVGMRRDHQDAAHHVQAIER